MRKSEASRPFPPDYVSATTLAYRLDLSEGTVRDYVRAGMLPKPRMVGNLQRWFWPEIEAAIEAQNALAGTASGDNGVADEYSADIAKLAQRLPKTANDSAS
jgi:hypothetical protein